MLLFYNVIELHHLSIMQISCYNEKGLSHILLYFNVIELNVPSINYANRWFGGEGAFPHFA